ncbi:MAG: hypothetical protein L6265_08295 [Thermoplasmatales archaeon]|nr:hypothetical protein [Thermoplasmatales archaeon]
MKKIKETECNCIKKTRIQGYKWDSPLLKHIYTVLSTTCNLKGLGCKAAESLKEKHTVKEEITEEICECK